ncbi:10530_t:CDS:2, partial [Acaulospora morrowiae]
SQTSKKSLKVATSVNEDNMHKKSKKRDHETTGLSSGVNKQMKKSKVVSKNNGTIIKNGTFVAAKQPKSKDPEENWILATVVDYRADTKHYEIEDIDKDEALNRPGERFSVPSKNVIEIPNQGEMRIPEFPQSHTVIALYPSTTCFYKAVVVTPPSKSTPRNHYLLAFEDDEGVHRHVEAHHVLEMPDDIK